MLSFKDVSLESSTPMMKQYLGIKKKNKDYILFFRLGDFYEMFYDDAVEVSRFLQITLTARGTKTQKIPMCGIPYHASENYIGRLIKGGYKVAICEQVQDASETKGIVQREVVRYYTPGTIVSGDLLDDKKNHHLVSYFGGKQFQALAYIDLSVGEFKTIKCSHISDLLNELERLAPKEILHSEKETLPLPIKNWAQRSSSSLSPFDDWAFSLSSATKTLKDFFHTQSLDGFGLKDMNESVQASGALLHYVKEMHGGELRHIRKLQTYSCDDFMVLDVATQRNLELVHSFSKENTKGTLLSVMDRTITSAGARLLRQWMLQPLRQESRIKDRLSAVKELCETVSLKNTLRENLKNIQDIQRIVARVETKVANARDLLALNETLQKIPFFQKALSNAKSLVLQRVLGQLKPFSDLQTLLSESIIDEPPFSIREGGFIRPGYHEALDELRSIKDGGKEWLTFLQESERSKTNIKTLKVKYNKVFGYYLEVPTAYIDKVPEHYIRKQTMANAERFITPELKEKEALILGANDRISNMEYDLFENIRQKVSEETISLQKVAELLSVLDVFCSYAEIASEKGYCHPLVNSEDKIIIEEGRHPVVEDLLEGERFVDNNTHLSSEDQQVLIITGPNMAGKSTYIRQIGLIVYMSQIGSFVPAKSAQIGIVDRIFTRVGAADELARGQSTFMLEMNETANIMNNATSKSLIILDEVGRGTSTLDGLSIAWALAEYLHETLKAKTIFATHYHEMTSLENQYEHIKNYHVACQENNDEVIFLHKIIAGATDKSYGIHVASLAGIPQSVVNRATVLLESMESKSGKVTPFIDKDAIVPSTLNSSKSESQHSEQTLVSPPAISPIPQSMLEKLKALDTSSLRPIDALMLLDEIVSQVKKQV
ncbi:DNA mismatch repair protein MutS [PVC group bacterium (ex Bugula neritina AB1)]|nr:DNA mismatch repair protein MutS [PVC group bacterium (ex Bugula neritina AB1)]